MGNLLGSPVTDKETFRDKTSTGLDYGLSSMQGWRIHMEDAHICLPELYAEEGDEIIPIIGTSLFAVFDGHGGRFCADFASRHFVEVLSRNEKMVQFAKEMSSTDKEEKRQTLELLEDALRESFMDLDMELLRVAVEGTSNADIETETNDEGRTHQPEAMDESGTTIVVVVVTKCHIICANAGDSRAVYKTAGKASALSYDHKPTNESEESRIRNAGGFVNAGRVDGDLAVSRGLGDFRFKTSPHLKLEEQRVSPEPDIIVKTRNDEKDEFIILACDGIWDVATNQECVEFVSNIFCEGETDFGLACEEVLDICLRLGSKDNMTSLIVQLPALRIGEGGGVVARRQLLNDSKNANESQNQNELNENVET